MYFYHSGYTAFDKNTRENFIVQNSDSKLFHLDGMLKKLGNIKNTYVVALIDSIRYEYAVVESWTKTGTEFLEKVDPDTVVNSQLVKN